MNPEPIGQLIRLRYRLLWAKTRSRSGKIALFAVGYLLLVAALAFLGMGGFGAGMAAVRLGKAELVARIVLGALFVQATMATVVMGFGISEMFGETELRRFPLTAHERWLARHITGILDPFWFLVLALELGLMVGLYAMGATGFWMGLTAVLELMLANYLLARMVALAVERLLKRKAGAMVLMAGIIVLSMLPGTLASALRKNPALTHRIVAALQWTPPFGAAAAMTRDGSAAFYGLALMAWWIVGLAAAVTALERRPKERQAAAARQPISWGGLYERIAGLFGADDAPLVGHWLRFYVRNTRFRTLYLLSLPLAAFLTYQMGSQGRHAIGLFAAALGTFPMCGFLGTSRIAVNLFGYTGGGFRRFLLLPARPADILRAASYASVLLGASTVALALVAWVAISPVASDARMLAMLAGSGLTGLFGLHAAGLWTTLYGPRRGNYNSSLGNDMSAAGNVTVIGGMLGCLLAPQLLARRLPALFSPENWWVAAGVAASAMAFYFFSLRITATQLTGRRERLMAVVEGRA